MRQPAGVIVISILDFLGMAILLCLGALAFVGMGFLATMMSRGSGNNLPPAFFAGLGIFLGIVCLISAGIAAALGYGMWTLKSWARILQIVFAVIGIVGGGFGVMFLMFRFSPFSLGFGLGRLALNIWILWYLLQPHVKAAFQPVAAAAPAR
jgi:hypothetical protein